MPVSPTNFQYLYDSRKRSIFLQRMIFFYSYKKTRIHSAPPLDAPFPRFLSANSPQSSTLHPMCRLNQTKNHPRNRLVGIALEQIAHVDVDRREDDREQHEREADLEVADEADVHAALRRHPRHDEVRRGADERSVAAEARAERE